MKLNEFTTKFKKIGMGKFTKCVFEKNIDGYVKTTSATIRFVNYYNLKEVKEKIANGTLKPATSQNTSYNTIIKHVLSYNTNTQNYLVQVCTCPKGKATTTYKDPNGNTIDKTTYETALKIKPGKKEKKLTYRIKLQELVSLG